MKKLVTLLLVSLMLTGLLSCSTEPPEDTPPSEATPSVESVVTEENGGKQLKITQPDGTVVELPVERLSQEELAAYAIVRPEEADEVTKDAAVMVYRRIFDSIAEIEITTDWVKRGEAAPTDTKEILVGQTNRLESSDGTIRANDYFIKYENNRLVINGGNPNAVKKAVELFYDHFIDEENKCVYLPTGDGYVYRAQYVCDSLTLGGVELSEYMIEAPEDREAAKLFLENAVVALTGQPFAGESEYKIVIQADLDGEGHSVSVDGKTITLNCAPDLNSVITAGWFVELIKDSGQIDLGKTAQTVSAAVEDTTMTQADILLSLDMEPLYIWVAPDGNDEADGSENAPLATLKAAQAMVREKKSTALAPIVVNLRGGEYYTEETLEFTGEDSGVEGMPVTWRAYNGEQVLIHSGLKIDKGDIVPADDDFKGQVADQSAAGSLMMIDLSKYDIMGGDFDIFIGDERLILSRWPNDIDGDVRGSYIYDSYDPWFDQFEPDGGSVAEVTTDEASYTFAYNTATAERSQYWSAQSKKAATMKGFFGCEWMTEENAIAKFDDVNGTITISREMPPYGRYYFRGIPEELDYPGEYYFKGNLLYFYPPADCDYDNVYLSENKTRFISMNGTEYLTLEGIDFMYSRSEVISTSEVNHVTIQSCDMKHTARIGNLSGMNILVDGCKFFDMSNGGVSVTGGDSVKMIHSNTVISNCEFISLTRSEATYTCSVAINGVGVTVRNNKFCDAFHEAMHVGSNDAVIEYNEFCHISTDAGDSGVIYKNGGLHTFGQTVRYNYFHDIGNELWGLGVSSVYCDDGSITAEVYGNIFDNASSSYSTHNLGPVKFNRGKMGSVHHNVFLNDSVCVMDWGSGEDWYRYVYKDQHQSYEAHRKMGLGSQEWQDNYKGTIWEEFYNYYSYELDEEYASLSSDEVGTRYLMVRREIGAIDNDFYGNLIVNVEQVFDGGKTTNKVKAENYITDDLAIFEDYSKYRLTEAALAEIRETIPEFEIVSFDQIGPQK